VDRRAGCGKSACPDPREPRGRKPLRRPDQYAKPFIYGHFRNDAKLTLCETWRALPALEAVLKSWKDRLLPSVQQERGLLDKRAEELGQKEAGAYPDDYLTDEYADLEETEQILRALLAVGVYHIFEQHMVRFFYGWSKYYRCKKPQDHPSSCGCKISGKPQLSDVINSFNAAWNIDLAALKSYPKTDELRLVANCVKHGEDKSCDDLKALRPEWFNPDLSVTPLSAFGLNVPAEYLEQAVEAVKSFLNDLKETLAVAA
jgi:hypothetical protein